MEFWSKMTVIPLLQVLFFKLPKIDILNEMKHTHDKIAESVFFCSFHTRTDTIIPINKSKFLKKLLDNFMILIAMVQF